MRSFTAPDSIAAELIEVERIIHERLASQEVVLQVAGHYLLGGERQRVRAILALLAAHMGSAVDPGVRHAAAAVELIHYATQAHQQVLHPATDGEGTDASASLPHDAALMIGDYLFALAASEMSLAPDARIIEYFSQAVMTISESNLLTRTQLTPFATAHAAYLQIKGANTAALFAAACQSGMICGAGTPDMIERMAQVGYNFGVAFAIATDLQELAAGHEQPSDRVTLPLLQPRTQRREALTTAQIIRAGGAQRAHAEAERFMQQALAACAAFPPSAARSALDALAQQVLRTDLNGETA